MSTKTLTDFLLARIAEAEAATIGHLDNYVQRERAECDAKRRIVALHTETAVQEHWHYSCTCGFSNHLVSQCSCGTTTYETGDQGLMERPCPTLALLALPFADHPDYREEWKP